MPILDVSPDSSSCAAKRCIQNLFFLDFPAPVQNPKPHLSIQACIVSYFSHSVKLTQVMVVQISYNFHGNSASIIIINQNYAFPILT